MRRTRHVVLPVRSWEHVGLMVVSLACLTLGLVSRDREGQAGSLAGPDLQHCAPHKVDACPNEDVFTRLLFYDDLATSTGPMPTDQPKNRELGSHRGTKSTRRTSEIRMSRSEAGRSAERRDVRLSERQDERRSHRFRDSRSTERDLIVMDSRRSIERRDTQSAERRNQQQSQRLRISRALERDTINRNSPSVAERRNDGLRYSERVSAGQKFRLMTERREARLAERRNDRRSQVTQRATRSLKRDSLSQQSQLLIERSAERRNSAISRRREERDFSAGTSQLVSDRRDDRRSRERDSVARNSLLSSERRDRNNRLFDRVTRSIRTAQSFDEQRSVERDYPTRNSPLIAERMRDNRSTMDRKLQYVRSLDRDSTGRNLRNVAERRVARSLHRNTVIRNSRNIRSDERGLAIRISQLDDERRDDRLSRLRFVTEERRAARLSENRNDRRTQRSQPNPGFNRNFALKHSRSETDRETELRAVRLSMQRDDRQKSQEARDARSSRRLVKNFRIRSLERDSTMKNSRFIVERQDERRDLRSLDRESTARSSRIAAERADVRLSERKVDQRIQRARRTASEKSRIVSGSRTEHGHVRLSEQRDDRRGIQEVRDARSYQRNIAIRNSRNARSLESDSATRNSRLVAERGEAGISRKIRDVPSFARDSAPTDLRTVTEERREVRLSTQRDRQRESREVRDIRSSQRNAVAIRDSRDARSLERELATRNVRFVADQSNGRSHRQTRDSRSLARDSRMRNLHQIINRKDSHIFERRVELKNRQRFTTERRENRVNDHMRDNKSLERDLAVGREASLIRNAQNLIYTKRNSATRTSLITSERVRINSFRNDGNIHRQSESDEWNNRLSNTRHRSMMSGSTAEIWVDRSSRLKRSTDRHLTVPQKGERNEGRRREITRENERESGIVRAAKSQDVRAIKVPEIRKIREERGPRYETLHDHKNRMISVDILAADSFPLSSTYQGLRQTAILILCAIYGVSLFSGKGSIARNMIWYVNRFVIW